MAQIKIYGHRTHLDLCKQSLSDTLHACVVESLGLPTDKRFQRFIPLDLADFIHPADRSEKYTILEISMFSGRTKETKKQLIRLIFERFERDLNISPQDVEIKIQESPKENWGIRGVPGDELGLNYKVEV